MNFLGNIGIANPRNTSPRILDQLMPGNGLQLEVHELVLDDEVELVVDEDVLELEVEHGPMQQVVA